MSRSETSREVSVTASRARRDRPAPLAGAIDERAAMRLDQTCPRRAGDRTAHAAHRRPRTRPSSLELAEHELGALLRSHALGVDDGSRGSQAPRTGRDTPVKLLDLAGERLRVEALHVAPRALVDRCVDVDLDEAARTPRPSRAPSRGSRAYGRDRRRRSTAPPLPREPRGDPADALDVRVAVLLREAEPLRTGAGEPRRRPGTRRSGRGARARADRSPRSSSCPDPERPVNQRVNPLHGRSVPAR